MTLRDDQRQKNVEYHYHRPSQRIGLIASLVAAMVFFVMAGYAVMSDLSPPPA